MQSSSLKQLSVLMATVFVDMMGFSIVLPTMPYYAVRLGARPVDVRRVDARPYGAPPRSLRPRSGPEPVGQPLGEIGHQIFARIVHLGAN